MLMCRVPTLKEVLDLAMRNNKAGKQVGVYVETKEPTYHDRIGIPLEPLVLNALVQSGLASIPRPFVILQSFEMQVKWVHRSFYS